MPPPLPDRSQGGASTFAAGLLALAALGAAAPVASAASEASAAPKASAELERAIEDLGGSSRQRAEARAQLVELGASATPTLLDRLGDPSATRRWELVTVLGMTGDPAALGPLADRVVLEADRHVRWRSLWAIRSYPEEMWEPALAVLRAGLAGGNGPMRWKAAVGLAALGRSDGLALLHEGLSSPEAWMRWEAVHALGDVHDESSVARLGEVLRSSEERDRREAVQSLGKIGDAESLRLLNRALLDPSARVRRRACRPLGLMGGPEAAEALRSLLSRESDEDVREQAEAALEKLSARH